MREDIKYWIAFNNIPGIGRVRLSHLEKYFGTLENAWNASIGDIKKSGIENVAVRSIEKYRPEIFPDEVLEKVTKYGVKAVTYKDNEYPARLKEIYDFPPVLYLRGSLVPEDEWCLAVVGTR